MTEKYFKFLFCFLILHFNTLFLDIFASNQLQKMNMNSFVPDSFVVTVGVCAGGLVIVHVFFSLMSQ